MHGSRDATPPCHAFNGHRTLVDEPLAVSQGRSQETCLNARQQACCAGTEHLRTAVCRGLICADLLARTTLLLDYGRRRLAFLPSERELLDENEE